LSIKAYDIPIPRKRPDGSFDPRELESWMRNVYKKFSAIENFVNAVLSAGDGITLTFDSTSNTLEIKTTVEMPAAAALGDMVYADGAASWNRLTGNTSSTKKYLAMTGDGTNANTPSWETVAATSLSSMTSAELATILTDETGTGKVVFSNSPVLVTPNIGNAVGVTVNKVFITTPTTSATLTIADGKTLTCNASITITGTDSETLTLTKGLTVTTNAGTIAFGAASKTLTVEDNSLVNQDLTTDASPTFVTAKLSGLSDGKIPYHVDDATGLADGPTKTDVDSAVSLKHTQGTDTTLGNVTANINMNTHKLTSLSVPVDAGDSIRATTKITEANLEDAVDKKHAVGDSIAASISDGDTTHSPDGNSVFDALALKAPIANPTFTGTVTVGAGNTLNVSAGTLTLADNQISGDKVEGGTIAATTITALTNTTINTKTPNQILGDGTANRVMRVLIFIIENGTDAGTIKVTTQSRWNGDANAAQDNIGKSETEGVWNLNVGGNILTLFATGITGDAIAALSGILAYNASGTAITFNSFINSGNLLFVFYNATTGAVADLTTLVDTGSIWGNVTYLTSA